MGGNRVRVIVCGTRSWHDRKPIIDRLADLPGNATVVHGGAKGADRIAMQEAQKLGLLVEEHLPDYGKYGKRAPLVRNQEMAALGADLCIAFWDGRSTGTEHMIDRARDHDIHVDIVMKQ